MKEQKDLKVAVVGLGGIGTHLLHLLTQLGIRRYILVDRDVVEEKNLERQGIYKLKDIGQMKVEVCKKWIEERAKNPEIHMYKSIDEAEFNGVDIIFDCLDNIASRLLLWKTAAERRIPLISGMVWDEKGSVFYLPEPEDVLRAMQILAAVEDWKSSIAPESCSAVAVEMVRALKEYLKGFKIPYVLSISTESSVKAFIPKKKIKPDKIAIKFSELSIKSKKSRKKLLKLVFQDLKERGAEGKIDVEGGVVFLEYTIENWEIAKTTFGAALVEAGIAVPKDLEKIKETALKVFLSKPGSSFRITASRSWKKYPLTSLEIERAVGSYLKDATGAAVKLKEPSREITVEIYRLFAFIPVEKVKGPGGLPKGSQGKAVMLTSGGFDSPVALWLLGRRGVTPVVLNFYPNSETKKLLVENLRVLKKYFGKIRCYFLKAERLFSFLKEKVPEGYRQVMLKIAFYKTAEEIAVKESAEAIATGESIGQTSSQTLKNLAVIESFIKLPVLRPLAGLNKEEIIDLARKIGTFEKSKRVREFCRLESHSIVAASAEEIRKLVEKTGLKSFLRELLDDVEIVEL